MHPEEGKYLPTRWNSIRDAVIGNRLILGLKFSTELNPESDIDYKPVEFLVKLMNKNKNIKSKNIEASDFSLKPMISQRKKKNLL